MKATINRKVTFYLRKIIRGKRRHISYDFFVASYTEFSVMLLLLKKFLWLRDLAGGRDGHRLFCSLGVSFFYPVIAGE